MNKQAQRTFDNNFHQYSKETRYISIESSPGDDSERLCQNRKKGADNPDLRESCHFEGLACHVVSYSYEHSGAEYLKKSVEIQIDSIIILRKNKTRRMLFTCSGRSDNTLVM